MTNSPSRQVLLVDHLRAARRVSHCNLRTQEAYALRGVPFFFFHQKHHPLNLGTARIIPFLFFLVVEKQGRTSGPNQIFHALLFVNRTDLKVNPGQFAGHPGRSEHGLTPAA